MTADDSIGGWKSMLRFLASAAFVLQSVWYGLAAVRIAVLLVEEAPRAAVLLSGFWGLAALVLLSSGVVLFRSRGESTLHGGRASLILVLGACAVTGLIATIFGLAGAGEGLKDPPISDEAERWLRGFFVMLAAQSAFVGGLGAAATILPYLRRKQNVDPRMPLPAS